MALITQVPFTNTYPVLLYLRLAASSASIALPFLGEHSGPFDSLMCDTLTRLGDHLVQPSRSAVPDSLITRIPTHFKQSLRLAYSAIFLVDDNALTLSVLNGNSPLDYPDRSKFNKALLMVPTPELIELEQIRFAHANAQSYLVQYGDPMII